jgi:hypothetical protein
VVIGRSAGAVERENVAPLYQLVEGDIGSLETILDLRRRAEGIVVDDLDIKALQALRDIAANIAETQDTDRFARKLAAEGAQFGIDPLALAHRLVCECQPPQRGQDEHDRMFGHRAGIGAGRNRHVDTLPLGAFEIDLVDADAPFVDEPELWRFLQQLLGDRGRHQAEIALTDERMSFLCRIHREGEIEFRRRHFLYDGLGLRPESTADDGDFEFVGRAHGHGLLRQVFGR